MRKPLLVLKVVVFSCLILSPLACFASVREESVNYARSTLDSIMFWLAIAPEILNLILVLLSLYLMLDGVRRWGTNTSGAFSRSLIGLFILHTSNLEISFLPYLALFLEIWLCARGFEARTKARLSAELMKKEDGSSHQTEEISSENWNAQTARELKLDDYVFTETCRSIDVNAAYMEAQTARALKLSADVESSCSGTVEEPAHAAA